MHFVARKKVLFKIYSEVIIIMPLLTMPNITYLQGYTQLKKCYDTKGQNVLLTTSKVYLWFIYKDILIRT